MTEVYLIRHSVKMRVPVTGKTKEFDLMQPLSAEGEERAKKLLEFPELRGADYAVASNMSRSLATLRYLIEADGVPFAIDERLREMPGWKRPEIVPGSPLCRRNGRILRSTLTAESPSWNAVPGCTRPSARRCGSTRGRRS